MGAEEPGRSFPLPLRRRSQLLAGLRAALHAGAAVSREAEVRAVIVEGVAGRATGAGFGTRGALFAETSTQEFLAVHEARFPQSDGLPAEAYVVRPVAESTIVVPQHKYGEPFEYGGLAIPGENPCGDLLSAARRPTA